MPGANLLCCRVYKPVLKRATPTSGRSVRGLSGAIYGAIPPHFALLKYDIDTRVQHVRAYVECLPYGLTAPICADRQANVERDMISVLALHKAPSAWDESFLGRSRCQEARQLTYTLALHDHGRCIG